MSARCFRAETSKLLKGNRLVVLAAVLIVLIMLTTAAFAVIEHFGMGGIFDSVTEYTADPSEYDSIIEGLKDELKAYDEIGESAAGSLVDYFTNTRQQIVRQIALYEYMRDNGLTFGEVKVAYDGTPNIRGYYGYMSTVMGMIFGILVFYAVIMTASLISGEYKDGTLKMQLLRPNSRAGVLTAKFASVFATAMLVASLLLSVCALYASVRYGITSDKLLIMFTSKTITLTSGYALLFGEFVGYALRILAMIAFTGFMCSITNYGKTASFALPIAYIIFGDIATWLLKAIYCGVLDFNACMSFMNTLGPTALGIKGMSFFVALPLLIAYIAVFFGVSYARFAKKDIN